jgi:hypothetical protein
MSSISEAMLFSGTSLLALASASFLDCVLALGDGVADGSPCENLSVVFFHVWLRPVSCVVTTRDPWLPPALLYSRVSERGCILLPFSSIVHFMDLNALINEFTLEARVFHVIGSPSFVTYRLSAICSPKGFWSSRKLVSSKLL